MTPQNWEELAKVTLSQYQTSAKSQLDYSSLLYTIGIQIYFTIAKSK